MRRAHPWHKPKDRKPIVHEGESTVQERGAQFDANAAKAAGIGQTDGEEHTTQDRYGDGRQPWQIAAANEVPADDKSKDRKSPLPCAILRGPMGV